MGVIRTAADSAFRDYTTDGVAASGDHEPVPSEIRATFGIVEDEIEGVRALAVAGIRWAPETVRVRSTGNVSIASGLENGDTLNGVTLVTGDSVFLGSQTNAAANGFYTVVASGTSTRSPFADSAARLSHIGILVSEGAAGAGERWTLPLDANEITLGTTPLIYARTGLEVSVSAEVATGRGGFGSLGSRLDELEARLEVTEQIELALGRAALYGVSDPILARLFVQQSRELDFTQDYFRDGFAAFADENALPGWVFTRASSGTAEEASGSLVVFPSGEPRITTQGLLLEAGSTQGLAFSSAFDSWTKASVAITTANPDYAGQPARYVTATASGASLSHAAAGISKPSPGTTLWCVAKKGTGATTANRFAAVNVTTNTNLIIMSFNYDTGEVLTDVGAPTDVRVQSMGLGWWRIAMTPSTGIANGDAVRIYAGFLGEANGAGDYFQISHAQVENTGSATSRIINNTGAAAARAADSAHVAFDSPGDFTVLIEAKLRVHAFEEVLLSIDSGADTNRLTLSRQANGAIRLVSVVNGASASVEVADKGGARTLKAAITCSATLTGLSVDGGEPMAIALGRPAGLIRMWLGRSATGTPFNGYLRRVLVHDEVLAPVQLRAMTAPVGAEALSSAPLRGNPLQGRFNPSTASTPSGVYGRVPIVVYGALPCSLLIGEMKGPSAIVIDRDGVTRFRDILHLGRWIDVDPLRGFCLVGDGSYRRVRWLTTAGELANLWELDAGIPGEIYGLRTNGQTLVVNVVDGADAETWIWILDNNGFPSGSGTKFTAFSGAGKAARSMLIADAALWIAALDAPVNAQGCIGAVESYDLATGALTASYYGHYPSDVDRLPTGEIVWIDEHLNRVRAVDPATGTVRSVMAGLKAVYDYEPSVSSMSANVAARATTDGSDLSAAAVEYQGLNALYSPNGLSVIGNGFYAIADTDNGRVIVARESSDWRPEVVAVVALLNEPTKVRVIPT